jgi:hypothetical protein
MTDYALKLDRQIKRTRRSLGVQNRQAPGFLVPFNFSGADVFDDTDTMDVLVSFPDRVYRLIEAKCWILFREFFTGAKSASSSGTLTSDSGGGSTSGSSSSSSSNNASLTYGLASAAPHTHTDPQGGNTGGPSNTIGPWIDSIDPHNHGITHTHSTPNHQHNVAGHTHSLTYGVFKETYPASHSVTLKVYELTDTTWTLRGTIAGLTANIVEVDLLPYMNGPGLWRLTLKSDAAQPNGGRLGCDVAGHVLGAIMAA